MATNDEYIRQLLEERARAEAEKVALIQEFTKSLPEEWSPDDLKDKIRDLLGKAFARVSATIDDDDNPSLAYKAAKDVLDIGMGRIVISDANDPNREFKELLQGLKPKTENEKIIEGVIAEERSKNAKDDENNGGGATDS